mgnify:FL=1
MADKKIRTGALEDLEGALSRLDTTVEFLRMLYRRKADAAEDFKCAVDAVAERFDSDPTALRRSITALERDKVAKERDIAQQTLDFLDQVEPDVCPLDEGNLDVTVRGGDSSRPLH